MPRGKKSKLRAREKRYQPRDEAKGLGDAQGIAAEKEDSASSASPHLGDSGQNLPTAGIGSTPESPETAAGISGPDSDEGAKGPNQEGPNSSHANERSREDALKKQAVSLVQFLLQKYHEKAPIIKADMLKYVNKKYKRHFPEILKRASEHMELVFGVNLKEVDPIRHCYTFINKLECTFDNTVIDEESVPKTGLLMAVLGVIFAKGNCATEEDVWEVLNMMGIYAGRQHVIYGEPKKLLTQELVQMQYLEYRQVANSDPPRYEFLWGPRSYAETSKMKVLEFLASVNDTTPSALSLWYEEALKDEEERARARIEARAHRSAKATACSRIKPSSSSWPK